MLVEAACYSEKSEWAGMYVLLAEIFEMRCGSLW